VKGAFDPAKRGPSANLDFLRSIAVLLVLAQHLCLRLHIGRIGLMPTTAWGLFGVLLFFVHTSLVLTYSLERSRLSGAPLLKNFYIRRIFRIYPASILAVCTALALHLNSDINGISGLSHGQLPGALSIGANLMLVQNLAHAKSIVDVLWSLPFELQMYVFLPFLFIWIRGRKMFWPLLGVWILSVVAAMVQPHISGLGRLSILLFVPNFLPGIVAYSRIHVPRIQWGWWPPFVLALATAFTFRPVASTGWGLCLLLGILIPSFAEIPTPWLRWVGNHIATYSYGIYLSHQFCIWLALGVLAPYSLWLRIAVLVASLVALPVLLYHAIEKPMIGVGVRIAERISGRPPARAVDTPAEAETTSRYAATG
jgi:peptidoglycan/LPS O-acetylase OafA/YrhL